MNAVIVLVCLLITAAPLLAEQPDSVRSDFGNGGFVMLYGSPTSINSSTGVLIGGGLCGVFDHHIRIGILGAFLANNVHGNDGTRASKQTLAFGYGGVYGEYSNNPESNPHLSVNMLVGAGGLLFHGPSANNAHRAVASRTAPVRSDTCESA